MTHYGKHMLIALTCSTVVMLLNIFAVTSGIADVYYSELTEWLNSI